LTKWQRFWKIEVANGAIGLVWNGMMSFGGPGSSWSPRRRSASTVAPTRFRGLVRTWARRSERGGSASKCDPMRSSPCWANRARESPRYCAASPASWPPPAAPSATAAGR
jgi:hypothetical protein